MSSFTLIPGTGIPAYTINQLESPIGTFLSHLYMQCTQSP